MLNITIIDSDKNTVTLEGTCIICGNKEVRIITHNQLERLQAGKEYIQNIFPDETPGFREFFLNSHICEKCWDKLFKEEDQ